MQKVRLLDNIIIVQYYDPLCAELFQRNAYYADKRFIGDLYFVFLG